jgi:hypothetical protein
LSNHHEQLARKDDTPTPSERGFGITFAVVFALLALWLWLRKDLPSWAIASAVLGVASLAAAYLAPAALRPFNRLWFKFGMLLHHVVTPLIMGLLFFLVVTPMGIVMRALGKDFLRLKRGPGVASYWVERTPETDAQTSMKNQF